MIEKYYGIINKYTCYSKQSWESEIMIKEICKIFKEIYQDLKILKQRYNVSYLMAILSNRGFHSLIFYRIANFLYKKESPYCL